LFTNVSPAATIAQVEIFGPVLVSMTFRTPAEAVELANNTPYGLAASVWTENINLALDVAPKIKAGVVWVIAPICSTPPRVSEDTGSPGSGARVGKRDVGVLETELGAGSREREGTSQAPASEGSQGHGGYRSPLPAPSY